MNAERSIVIDPRDAEDVVELLDARSPGFIPGWSPGPEDPGRALERIAARYAQAIIQRLNQAPSKNELAFLDLLGQRLAPARAARAPIVFRLSDGVAGGLAPAGTGIAAPPPPGTNQPIAFETEREVGVTPGKLVQLYSLWPGRDEYIDHGAALGAKQPLRLFSPEEMQQAPHILYLSHQALLELTGNVELRVEFQLEQAGSDALDIAWEYWDGKVWRGFALVTQGCADRESLLTDATTGLTSSGVVTLRAEGAVSDKIAVNGQSAYWLRGRLTEALPPDPARQLPVVDGIRLSSIVNQPLRAKLAGKVVKVERSQASERQGQLLNEAGQPIAGAVVVVSDPKDPTFGQTSMGTDDSGGFAFDLAAAAGRLLHFDVTFLDVEASTALEMPAASSSLGLGFVAGSGSGFGLNLGSSLTSSVHVRKLFVSFPVTRVVLTAIVSGAALDKAYNDGTKLDTTKPFYPFGQFPQPGATFYFTSAAIFAKPGARVRFYLPRTTAVADSLGVTSEALRPLVTWEYWNGVEWAALLLTGSGDIKGDFSASEIIDFVVPVDLVPTTVNEEPAAWMRARLVGGGFGFVQTMTFNAQEFKTLIVKPPILAAARLGYGWQFGPFHPERVLAFNDFAYQDRTYEATWPGATFQPYQRMADVTPTLYLGFDRPAPPASIGLFIDVLERPADPARPRFLWEYWDGFEWFGVPVEDETADLTSPGILSYVAESDSTALPRFGEALHWLRGRLKEDGPPPVIEVQAIHPNAVWALQRRTFNDVQIGAARGTPGEIFRIAQTPVIPGERLEVMELSGARANVEWRSVVLDVYPGGDDRIRELERLLGKEGPTTDIVEGSVRLRRDAQKRVSEVWVRWTAQPTLYFSGARDRHYAIDAARGFVFFGDGSSGRALPQGAQVALRQFQSGGGAIGNVTANSITQLLGAVSGVEAVFNPHAAEGGSDGETLESFRARAPASVRHRGRALSAEDYEAMVREASSAVAVVKALSSRNSAGRTLPGYLTILIIPSSQAPQPYPTRGLRDEVLRYLETRAPAGLIASGRIFVTGPSYYPVDVAVTLVPRRDDEAGSVESRVRDALERFLHPLAGGPSSTGWEFGRGVHRSDVARVIEGVEGVDHAELIQLLANEQVRGETVDVPPHQIVAAGKLRLRLKGARS
jgi:uncharacterized phage protein gp47/JayE